MVLQFMFSPRGFVYAAITMLVLLNLLIEISMIYAVVILFLIYAIIRLALEGFVCPMCWLGFISASTLTAVVTGLIGTQYYALAFALMFIDSTLHS